MFGNRYWPGRYFADRYWPPGVTVTPTPTPAPVASAGHPGRARSFTGFAQYDRVREPVRDKKLSRREKRILKSQGAKGLSQTQAPLPSPIPRAPNLQVIPTLQNVARELNKLDEDRAAQAKALAEKMKAALNAIGLDHRKYEQYLMANAGINLMNEEAVQLAARAWLIKMQLMQDEEDVALILMMDDL